MFVCRTVNQHITKITRLEIGTEQISVVVVFSVKEVHVCIRLSGITISSLSVSRVFLLTHFFNRRPSSDSFSVLNCFHKDTSSAGARLD